MIGSSNSGSEKVHANREKRPWRLRWGLGSLSVPSLPRP